ncbi:ATP-binding protein [Niallia sp. XMNu-256]|uniref:two-component system sensor histidine kinase NtrB n=1 Tax=Niallia sp. XMNu-256 TaxID=3082444 RepID=UPI0030D0CAEF
MGMVEKMIVIGEENIIDYYKLIENVASAIILLDGKKIIYANKAMGQLLKKDSSKLIGTEFNYLHPDDETSYIESCKRAIEYQQVTELIEQKLILDNGEVVEVEVTAAPFKCNGHFLIQANYHDITDKKTTEKLLIQSDKLSVLGEIASGIVHEIRNPLTSIKGLLQLISEDDQYREYLKIVLDEIDRIEDIVNELLFFSKPSKEDFIDVDICKIINETLFLFKTELFDRKITVDINVEDKITHVLGDRNQLKQVFINLIKNSIEAIGKNGKITVNINRKSTEKVCIEIIDNGIGIPKEVIKNLGKSFISTKEKGTGLGLMVTYNIIKNHKGDICVKSKSQVGTIFTVKLPSTP